MDNEIQSTILSKDNESLQYVTIGNKKIILSVLDSFNIRDYVSGNDDKYDYLIFSENITLAEKIKMKTGIISSNNIITLDKRVVIDVSGSKGEDVETINLDPQKASGDKGGAGTAGGNLDLYLENEDINVTYILIGNGGSGGNGQGGTLTTNGGDGGDGGDGGNIQAIIVHPYLRILSTLVSIYKNSNYDKKKSDLAACIKDMNKFSELNDIQNELKKALDNANTAEVLNDAIVDQGGRISILVEVWKSKVEFKVSAGPGGLYGSGKKSGQTGLAGKNKGKSTLLTVDNDISLLNKMFKPFIFIHPSQCAMLLEKAKLMYFSVDPIKNEKDAKDLAILLKRLQERTSIFNNLNKDSDLAIHYKNNEQSIGAVNSLDRLQQIYSETTNLLNNLTNGLDYFGYDNKYVPLTSFKFYEKLIKDLITNFSVIEAEYNSYYEKLEKQEATMDTIKFAKNQQENIITQSNSDITILRQRLLESAQIIDSYQHVLSPKKQAVDDEMTKIIEVIQNHFDFNAQSFLNSLSMLAFAPESKLMWVTLATDLMVEGTQKVTDDKGDQINKNYIVNKLKSIDTTFDNLVEGYSQLKDGSGKINPEDPDANKLIVSEDKLFNLLDDFYEQFPTQISDLKVKFKDYVDTIIARNNEILNYNSIIQLLSKNHQQVDQATKTLNTLDADSLKKLDPNIPGLATLVSQMYYTTRNILMKTFDLTARAYGYWSLDDNRNLIADAYGNKSLPEITTSTFIQAQNVILDAYRKAVEKFGNGAGIFPKKEDEEGIIFSLNNSQIECLKRYKKIMVKIPVVSKDTKKVDNPFGGACNYRLSKARVWVKGAKTADNILQINITHTGAEKIVDRQSTQFEFSHDPRYTFFKYDVTNNEIKEDGDLGWQDPETKEMYSLVGPFAYWNIQIDDKWNIGLDLSDVKDVKLEFHGTNYPFIC